MDYVIQKTQRKVKLKKRKSPIPLSVKSIHNEKNKYFEKLQTTILPKKLKELEILKKKNMTNITLVKEINDIKDRVEEFEYYFKTTKIIQEYFQLDEDIEKEDFNINYSSSRKIEVVRDYYNAIGMDLPNEYRVNLKVDIDICRNCNLKYTQEPSLEGSVCNNCGLVSDINISDLASYKEMQTVEYTVTLDYKRVDYFKQWLNQIQAKEQTEIPSEVVDTLILELKKERVKNISKISNSLVKRLLKKTGYSKYYEHIPFIINTINKIPPLHIPTPVENKLISMFEEIQIPWESVKSKDRKNFFSYPYTLHKFCQILGLNEYLSYFPLLKSREKLYKQDVTWKKIIEYLNSHKCINELVKDVDWRFIPSL